MNWPNEANWERPPRNDGGPILFSADPLAGPDSQTDEPAE